MWGNLVPMASDLSPLEHLAKVFLSGFRLDSEAEPEAAWKHIRPEFDAIAGTLREKEAIEFRQIVERLIRVERAGSNEKQSGSQ